MRENDDWLHMYCAADEDPVSILKREFCKWTGFSEDEVEIVEDNDMIHIIVRPKIGCEQIYFELVSEGEEDELRG